MPDIKKFPNIIEAMKYLEPGHLLTQCLERDGVAINYQTNMPVSMPDSLSSSESQLLSWRKRRLSQL